MCTQMWYHIRVGGLRGGRDGVGDLYYATLIFYDGLKTEKTFSEVFRWQVTGLNEW